MKKIYDLIEKNKEYLLNAEKWLWRNPETGFKEYKTNKFMIEEFEKMGYKLTLADGLTGFYTIVDTGKPGPTVLVLAELDSLINFQHSDHDKETGAVHNCGHHAQCVAMLGLAYALKQEGALDGLCGKIKLCCVPAEEGIEIGYRKELIQQGVIKYTTGKPEFIYRGYFDDVDLAFMMHVSSKKDKTKFILTKGHNGNVQKSIIIKGKSSHAGGSPWNGINALNAATLAISSINSLRETFMDSDFARVHFIITKGGDVASVVPAEVVMEGYVRASNAVALKEINDSVNRAISASVAANGAIAHIMDMSGSAPLYEDENLRKVFEESCVELFGQESYTYNDKWLASSTDMGDVSMLFPAIHFYATGSVGTSHGTDFQLSDPYNVCVNSAKIEYKLLRNLLGNNAEKARNINKEFTPTFGSIEEYKNYKDCLWKEKDTVIHNQDGTITIDYK